MSPFRTSTSRPSGAPIPSSAPSGAATPTQRDAPPNRSNTARTARAIATRLNPVEHLWHRRQRALLAAHGLRPPLLWRGLNTQQEAALGVALAALGRPDAGTGCWSNLMAACASGRAEAFQALLSLIDTGIVDPNGTGPEGETLLNATLKWAPDYRRGMAQQPADSLSLATRVALLIAHGAHADLRDTGGRLPIELARQREPDPQAALIQTLLHAARGTLHPDRDGKTVLHQLAAAGDVVQLAEWCPGDRDTDAVRDRAGRTPLMTAVDYRQVPVMAFLMNHADASVQATDRLGATVLHHAVDADATQAVLMLLLAHGADARAQARRGWTPQQLRAVRAYYDADRPLLGTLIAAGAEPRPPPRLLNPGICSHAQLAAMAREQPH